MKKSVCFAAILLALATSAHSLSAQGGREVPVEVAIVEKTSIVPTTSLLGATEPRRRSVVAATIEGYVLDYPIQEGDRVEKGTVLARLRDRVLRLRLKEAEAALGEFRERHRRAKNVLERAQQLIRTKAISHEDLDTALSEERALSLRIPQAEARIEILNVQIEKKRVVAPFAAQVVWEHTELGEWLSAGGKVATLVDLSSVYVRVNVPERHVRFVKKGAKVNVWIPAVQNGRIEGTVVSVSGQGDPEARTFGVRVEVANNQGALRAGMSARVEFAVGEARSALAVSKDAILHRGVRSLVFLIDAQNRAVQREVTVGQASGNLFEITSGVAPGDRVVIRGNERLRPQAVVRVLSGHSARGSTKRSSTKHADESSDDAKLTTPAPTPSTERRQGRKADPP